MAVKIATVFLSLLSLTTSIPTTSRPKPDLPLSARTVSQLSSIPTWLENIAARPNGDLLVTQLIPAPILYTIKNPSSTSAKLTPVYEFHAPNASILLGITETHPDTFAIIAGNATANATGYPGTFSVWEAKFTSSSSAAPAVRKLANIPAAKFLNGVIPLPSNPDILLIPDSQFGLLFRLDVKTGKSEIIAKRDEFNPYPERQNKTVGFGINGVRIRDGYLYFSNSNLVTIFRIKITRDGYIAQNGKAPVEVYADLNKATIFVDDFTFSDDGVLWAVSNDGNSVVAVTPGAKKIERVVGEIGEFTVAGGTAAVFGRGKADKEVLYVCTAGGLDAPVNGTGTEAGKVVAVDTKGYYDC